MTGRVKQMDAHPFADMVPGATDAEYAALKAVVAEHRSPR